MAKRAVKEKPDPKSIKHRATKAKPDLKAINQEIQALLPATKTVLLLKVVPANMTTRNGFVWPKKGRVEAPDWNDHRACGGGLHAWRWTPACNLNDNSNYHKEDGHRWLLVRAAECDVVDLGDKVKFRSGTVVLCGSIEDCIKQLQANPSIAGFLGTATAGDAGTATAGTRGTATAGYAGTATAGTRGTATAGYAGTATAGYAGTATAGTRGTATAGDAGTATAGTRGTATAGDAGTATAGYAGTATAGDAGTATAGYAGTATAGDAGTATAGYAGTATAGYAGTATAGTRGTATAGEDGLLVIEWLDEKAQKYRRAFGPVDGDKIKPNTKYKVELGLFVEVIENGQ